MISRVQVISIWLLLFYGPSQTMGQVSCGDFQRKFIEETRLIDALDFADLFDFGLPNLELVKRQNNISISQILSDFSLEQILTLQEDAEFVIRDLSNDNQLDLVLHTDDNINILVRDGAGFRDVFNRNITNFEHLVGDIDNDGDRDIIFSHGANVNLIRNNGNENFDLEEQSHIFHGLGSGSVEIEQLFDIDGDGDLEMLFKFTPDIQSGFGRFYDLAYVENVAANFFPLPAVRIASGLCGPIAVGDLDNDGDKDIVLGSSRSCSLTSFNEPNLTVFLNEAGIFQQNIYSGQLQYYFHDIQLGDIDNNGDLNIIGITEDFVNFETTTGEIVVLELTSCSDGFCSFDEFSYPGLSGFQGAEQMTLGDLDSDLDLDIMVSTCNGSCLEVLVNNACFNNDPPSAPTNLVCTPLEGGVRLEWDLGQDNNQPGFSLTYNIEVSSEDFSDNYIVSPESLTDSGLRKIVRYGDQCHNLSWEIRDLPTGNYCFRVQAIDHSFVGSSWSPRECCFMDLCTDAKPIFCGRDTIGDTADSMLVNNISDYFFCGAGSDFHQPELIYQIEDFSILPSDTSDIFISMWELGEEAEAGLDLFVVEDCNSLVDGESAAQCVESVVRTGDGLPAMIHIEEPNPNAEYFVIIDSKNTPGDFRLSISCPYECQDDDFVSCDQIRRRNNERDGAPQISAYYAPDSSMYFDNYAGSDYKVAFTAPADAIYSFDLIQDQSLLDLFILSECNPFECIAYDVEGSKTTKTIDLFLEQFATVYLVVDAPPGQQNDFELTVRCCRADSSDIFFEPNRLDTVICKSEEMAPNLTLAHSGPKDVPYQFYLTDTSGSILMLLDSQFIASELLTGIYRIYGVSYYEALDFEDVTNIVDVRANFCHQLSNNYLDLVIDSSHFFEIDTTICFGEILTICDSAISEAGFHLLNCRTEYGCDSVYSVNIVIDTPVVEILGNDVFCLGDSANLVASAGFDQYLWSTEELSDSIIVHESGTYSVTVTSINQCQDSASFSIVEQAELQVNLGPDTVICDGLNYYLSADTFAIYSWSTGDTTPMLQVSESGIYSVTVSDALGCIGSDQVEIVLLESPVANAKGERSICVGDSIKIMGEGGAICRWFDLAGNVVSSSCLLTDTPNISSTYVLEVMNQTTSMEGFNNVVCTDRDTIEVKVLQDSSNLQLIPDTLICAGERINLVASLNCDDCMCSWSTHAGLLDPDSCNSDALPMVSTTYRLTYTSRHGCMIEDSVFVGVADSPMAEAGPDDDLCPGDSFNLEGGGGDSCTWFDVQGAIVSTACDYSDSISRSSNFVLQVNSTTTFPGFGDKTCIDFDTINILVFDEGSGIDLIADTMICSGDQIDLVKSIECSTCSCEWSTEVGLEQPGQCITTSTIDETTKYAVIATSTNGCKSADSVTIEVVQQPVASFDLSNPVICAGDTVTISGVGGEICRWFTESFEFLDSNCTYLDVPQASRDYHFVATNEGSIACSDTIMASIMVVDPPAIDLIGDTSICRGSEIQLVKVTDCESCDCNWTPNNRMDDPTNCDPIITPGSDVELVLNAGKEEACFFSDTVRITVFEPTQIETKNDHFNLRQNNVSLIPLDSLFKNDPVLGSNPSLELITDDLPVEITVDVVRDQLQVDASSTLGLFEFQYVVQDLDCGDRDTATVELLVIRTDVVTLCNPDEETGGCQVIVDIENYQENDIAIFDREGNMVHIANPYLNDWDGRNIRSGERVPTGSYYFVLHLGTNSLTGEEGGTLKGVITIIRR